MFPEALVFDLGGVLLVGGEPVARRAWERRLGLAAGGLERAVAEAVGPGWAGGRSEADIRASLGAALGLGPERTVQLLDDLARDSHLDPVLMRFVARARARFPVAILANNGPDARRQLNARFGLETLVDLVVISAEEGLAKPDPGIYLLTAARLGVEPGGCVFVDDRPANVDGARRVGMSGVHHVDPHRTVAELERVITRAAPAGTRPPGRSG